MSGSSLGLTLNRGAGNISVPAVTLPTGGANSVNVSTSGNNMTVNVDGHSDSATIINSLSTSYSGSTLTINVNGRSASTTITSSADALKGTLTLDTGNMMLTSGSAYILNHLISFDDVSPTYWKYVYPEDSVDVGFTIQNVIVNHVQAESSLKITSSSYRTEYKIRSNGTIYVADLSSNVAYPTFSGTGTGYIHLKGLFSSYNSTLGENRSVAYGSSNPTISNIPRSDVALHVINGSVESISLDISGSWYSGSSRYVRFAALSAELSY